MATVNGGMDRERQEKLATDPQDQGWGPREQEEGHDQMAAPMENNERDRYERPGGDRAPTVRDNNYPPSQNEESSTSSSSASNGGQKRGVGKPAFACARCERAKRKCDGGRPCWRCKKLGGEKGCVDSPASAKRRKVEGVVQPPKPRLRQTVEKIEPESHSEPEAAPGWGPPPDQKIKNLCCAAMQVGDIITEEQPLEQQQSHPAQDFNRRTNSPSGRVTLEEEMEANAVSFLSQKKHEQIDQFDHVHK